MPSASEPSVAGEDSDGLPVMLRVCAYCACLWGVGHLCRRVSVSAAIGEILIGVLLGPPVFDVVPYSAVFQMAGEFGVTLMVFESGLHVSFDAMRTVGAAASGVAVLGSLVPLGSGLLTMYALDPVRYEPWPTGLAIGVALAPTSVGLALKMLKDARRLHAREGQLIMAAAFLDDVISLVLLTTLLEIGDAVSGHEGLAAWPVVRPLVLSVAFCALALGLGLPAQSTQPSHGRLRTALRAWVGLVPRVMDALGRALGSTPAPPLPPQPPQLQTPRLRTPANEWQRVDGEFWSDATDLPAQPAHAAARAAHPHVMARPPMPAGAAPRAPAPIGPAQAPFDLHAQLLLLLMLAALLGCSVVGDVIGSHLLGAFLAGVLFAAVPRALAVWHDQVKRIGAWLVRFFFGGTVAFAVPIRTMLAPRTLGLGMLLCAGPACLGKLVGAAAAGWHDLAIVGSAILGRGEFGFLVAETARTHLLNPAPPGFAGHELALRLQRAASGGGFCVDGNCGDGVGAGAPGEPDSFQGAAQWCAHCEGGACDTEPRRSVRYWQLGADCDAHPDACECVPMLRADAFAVVMWAIVGSSLLSPLLFRLALHRRTRAEEAAVARRKPSHTAEEEGAPAGQQTLQWTGHPGLSPYLRADLMI